jgi:uncharacterized membrane protein
MQYFGIKQPNGVVWWIASTEDAAWMSFFTYPNEEEKLIPHRLSLAEAIQAYKAIGYQCVELEIKILSPTSS